MNWIKPLILMLLLAPIPAFPAESPQPAAIVCSLSGKVWRTAGKEKKPAHLFDWLMPGERLQTENDSEIVVAMSNGARYRISTALEAIVASDSLKASSGHIENLPAVPPLPRFAPIVASEASQRSGAVRIRGEQIKGMYPHGEAVTIADQTTLRFDAVAGALRYLVEIEDETGNALLRMETDSNVISVAAGILKPGRSYYWKARTLDKPGMVARGETEFRTLSETDVQARMSLKSALEGIQDVSAAALLAATDRNLGLLMEARDELARALIAAPDNAELKTALTGLEQQLRPVE